MKSKWIAAALLALAPLGSALSAPVASGLTSGKSFEEYSGTAAVGDGQVNVSSTLWYVDEGIANGRKSWLIFFDPRGSDSVEATLTFDSAILNVATAQSGLAATHSLFSVDIDGDNVFDDYLYPDSVGLEPSQDSLQWTAGSNTLTLRWTASNPGDHIRVFTAVPEPASLALAGLALGAAAWVRRRRTA